MPDQLDFGDRTARRLERMYVSEDVRRRRRLASGALRIQPGQRLLDVGCGPGFHVAELAEAVGRLGHVIGVDQSATMLAAAADRTAGLINVTLLEGGATDLPVADASIDGALSVQVLEYVDDVGQALAEMRRVLRPGGRVVIWDIDWTTLSWHASDRELMRRVMKAWDQHLSHASLPRRLVFDMADEGFTDVEVEGHAFVNTNTGPDAYSAALIPMIADFVPGHGVTADEAAAWRTDLERLSRSDAYFFSITMFCFAGTLTA